MHFLTLLCVATLSGALSLAGQAPSVNLTYLANMGVLLEAGDQRVAIDAFHRGALTEYAAVPANLLEPLERAREPFRNIDLALTTHRHADHFDARSVASRLAADSTIVYIAAAETIDSLRARSSVLAEGSRTRSVDFEASGEVRFSVTGMKVSALDLPHNPTPSPRVANVGYLLELGGLTVLHVGDADPAAANFLRHNLEARRIDVAIVPFWYLTGADDAVRRSIGARIWVATHIPPADSVAIARRVLSKVPNAITLVTSGERHSLH